MTIERSPLSPQRSTTIAPHSAHRRPASLAISHARHARHARHRGFSLVELVIVIGIIVLLVGLTVGVVAALNRGSETRVTENILNLLDTAYGEWKTTADRDISYGVDGLPPLSGAVYEIQQAPPTLPAPAVLDFVPTRRLLFAILKSADSKKILSNINSKQFTTFTPALPAPNADLKNRVVDGWDIEIITVFPGRLWVNGFDPGTQSPPDKTILTEFEQVFGECSNRRVRFVSAGPDGRFGDLSAADGTQLKDWTKDNIYSYPLEAP